MTRADTTLQEMVEALDDHLEQCGGPEHAAEAFETLGSAANDAIDAELEKCVNSFRYYAENWHVIRRADGELGSMYPFRESQNMMDALIEKRIAETGKAKIVICKSRQVGGSEYAEARILWRTIFRPGSHNLVAAQDPGQSTYLMDKSRLAYDNLPWWMRPAKRYEQRGKLIEFDHKDSAVRQSTPGLKSVIFAESANKVTGVAIGKQLRTVHLSELSSWENERVLNEQLFPAMRLAPDLIAIMESTSRGRDGFWYPLWLQTLEGKFNDWVPLFVPAYVMKEYSIPIDPKVSFELTEEEKGIAERILHENGDAIPNEHFAWRREVMAEFNLKGEDPDKFMQEYPETWRESFQSSGLCAFDKRALQYMLNTTVERPVYVGEIRLEGKRKPVIDLVEHDPREEPPTTEEIGGRLRVWRMPEDGEEYYLGADVAMGNGGDFSCAQVLRIGRGMEPDEQVAEWHGWISPTPFAGVLAALGYWYNGCEIACELNDCGGITGSELWRILEYERLYVWKHTDKIKNFMTDYLGWKTNSKNRDDLIVKMREAVSEKTITLRSADLIEEMFDFGNDGGGRFEAVVGNDDRAMAAMICRYCAHEADTGVQSGRRSKVDVAKKGKRPAPYGMTDWSPIHDRPNSQEGLLHREHGVPAEYVALVSRSVPDRMAIMRSDNDDGEGWMRL